MKSFTESELFLQTTKRYLDWLYAVLETKRRVYDKGNDPFAPFDMQAEIAQSLPEEALFGNILKQWGSIKLATKNLAAGVHTPLVYWDEIIGDSINYLLLLRGIIRRRYRTTNEGG